MRSKRWHSYKRLLKRRIDWLNPKGRDSDIVLTTRIRLARNLKGYKFIARARLEEQSEIIECFYRAREESPLKANSAFYDIDMMEDIARVILIERRIIRPEMAHSEMRAAVVIFRGEYVSFTVNDEDHIRIRSVAAGREVKKAWEKVVRVYTQLSQRLDFAHNQKLGYLTCSPANVGTGLRVSFFCHLPGLFLTDKLDEVFETIASAGITIRGFQDGDKQNIGNIFQISNQMTLGLSEDEILYRTENIINQVVKAEQGARKDIIETDSLIALDRVHRSFAVLTNAYLLGIIEFISFVSSIRLGIDLGWITGITYYELNRLTLNAQPGHLSASISGEPTEFEVDKARADLVKSALSNAVLA